MAERRGGRVRGKVRDTIFAQDGHRCAYCLLDLKSQPRIISTLDHVIPVRDGGTNDPSNLIAACWYCNSARGARPIHVFAGRETIVRLIRDNARVARTIVTLMADSQQERAG
jgi:5-methylcytosine-specific restriction endonuclease McrA